MYPTQPTPSLTGTIPLNYYLTDSYRYDTIEHMKCLYCQKEVISIRGTRKFCNGTCRQNYNRHGISVTKIVPVSVTKSLSVTDSVTKEVVSVTERTGEKILKFSSTTSMEERIKKYRELYPDSQFVPNWVAHGFNSKEEAIKNAIKAVTKNQGIINMGLGND